MEDQVLIKLDEEWVSLVKEAKALGLSVEDVREFLLKTKPEKFF